jgi:hypothetical protein
MKLTLPTDSAARKRHPMARGPLAYAPAILAGVAEVCIDGNDKHNPGQPLHHARGKSADHADCIVRHLMDVQDIVAWIERNEAASVLNPGNMDEYVAARKALLTEVNQLACRALMFGQEIHETYGGAPLAPGARLPESPAPAGTADDVPVLLDYSHEMPLRGAAGADWRERGIARDERGGTALA